ncbi:MAG TPA: fumarylacetoacetate hydrolase family protein [Ignavibacteria bacterium]|jgi:5-carboxymethyl-2-hydroxymuconate isomerase
MCKLKVKDSSDEITVQNIYCVGKNYLEHIKEFDTEEKTAEIPKSPAIFLKPNTALISGNSRIKIPVFDSRKISDDLQNEVELVIVIVKDGNNISEDNAMDHVFGYAVGIDFTLRDIQSEMKKKGLPWAISKGFSGSAPVSEIVEKNKISDPQNLNIKLKINGAIKQNANTSQMIFKIPYIIHYISSIFGLRKDDIIFTGTPAGITKLNSGDEIEAELEEVGKLNIKVE